MAKRKNSRKEIWRPILGWEGLYSVSNLGRVYTERWSPRRPIDGILKPWVSSNGYPMVVLNNKPRRLRTTVHKLVMRAFRGMPPKNMEVLHNDQRKNNPKLENLKYGTRLQNVQEAISAGKHVSVTHPESLPRGENHWKSKLTVKDVLKIRRLRKSGSTQKDIACRFDISPSNVYRIDRRKTWSWLT